jgi:hypothetical protein
LCQSMITSSANAVLCIGFEHFVLISTAAL